MARPVTAPDRHTATAMHPLIGRTAMLPVKDMLVRVQINNVKFAYGDTRLLVTPMDGSGTSWVEQNSVTLEDDDAKPEQTNGEA
jgi:hypothetical protein